MHGSLIIGDTTAEVIYMPPNEISAVENALDIEIESQTTGTYNLFLDYDSSRYLEAQMRDFALTLEEVLIKMRNGKLLISEILN